MARLLFALCTLGAVAVTLPPRAEVMPTASGGWGLLGTDQATPSQVSPGPVSPSVVDERPAVLVVLDISGSMSEPDGDGRVKLDGARQAIDTFLQDIEPGTEVGLWTYPGSGADCSPGGLRIAISPVDTARTSASVRSLSAAGQTPTAAALRSAADELPTTRARTIVLVSDGESNCDEPPCPVAEDLARQGIDLSINTIGFQISDQGRQELTCIAGAARGRYKDVQDSNQLVDELNLQTIAILQMDLSQPALVAAAQASAPGGGVEIMATIRNISPIVARNVQAFLSYDVDRAPGGAVPRRRLGNLVPGEEEIVTWRFRPLLEFRDVNVGFEISLSAANAADVIQKGQVRIRGSFTAADGGPLLQHLKRVAILGDSYSAGEGTFDYLNGTDTRTNSCHRSSSTYLDVARANPPSGARGGSADIERLIIACSGAVTSDIYNPDWRNKDPVNRNQQLPAQIDQLTDSKKTVDAAFLTIGGNDVGFGDIIFACLGRGDCDGAQLPRFLAKLGDPSLPGGLPDALRDAYSSVHARLNSLSARKARKGRAAPIVVLAYPQIFPVNPSARADCIRLFSTKEIEFANTMASELNRVIGAVVDQVRSTGIPIWFASDVREALLPDHTMCDKVKWVNYVDAGDVTLAVNDQVNQFFDGLYGFATPDDPWAGRIKASFHPNKDGYHAMTGALIRWSASGAGMAAAQGLAGRPVAPLPVARTGAPVSTIRVREDRTATVERGSTYEIVVEGLPVDAAVDLILRSSPRLLCRVLTDAQGRARARVAIPLSTSAGSHVLAAEVVGRAPDGDVRQVGVTVRDASPRHHRLALGASGTSLVGGLACLVLGLRARRRALRSLRRS